MEENKRITFVLRAIQNQIKMIIHNTLPKCEKGPKSQLQGGILGYLYHHREQPVYQKDLEKEFRISGATATNTLQVMEREGLIVRKAQDRDARLKRIQMTEEALQGHARMEAHMEMMENCITEGMTEEEVRQLSRLLGMVMKNLERLAAKYDALQQENEPDFQPGPDSGENSPRKPPGPVSGEGSPGKPPGPVFGENSPGKPPGSVFGENSPEKPPGMVFGGGSPEKPPGMDSGGDNPEEAEEISEPEENSLSRDGPS